MSPAALAERQRSQVGTVRARGYQKHVTGAPCAAEKLVELWSAGLVGGDYLAVDNGVVNVEGGRHIVAERLEAAQDIAVARDEAATALLDVTQRSKPIVFEIEEPFRVIERLLSPSRDDRW
jgi:hypothetical protein